MKPKYEFKEIDGIEHVVLGDAIVTPYSFIEIDCKELNEAIRHEVLLTFTLALGTFDTTRLLNRIIINYLHKNNIVTCNIGE